MSTRDRIVPALVFLAALHAAVVFAGFLAPYRPEAQHRAYPFAPPTRLHFWDAAGRFHMRVFVYGLLEKAGSPGVYDEDTTRSYPVRLFLADQDDEDGGGDRRRHLFGVERPGHLFLLGTDGYGRDQLSRMLYGGRISLISGLLAAAVCLILALILGSLAGFYGTWLDEAIMRGSELLLALPWLYCLLSFRAFLPLNATVSQTVFLLILVMGLRGWARPARLIRGVILSAKERDYVLAARGFGASNLYLLTRHVLPQTRGLALTQAALLIPQYILAEVALSFLGLGISEPAPTWGNMLAQLQRYPVLASHWWMSLPGLILIPLFLCYHLLAEALHEKLCAGAPRSWRYLSERPGIEP